jgi:hypothetical protein
MKKRLIIAFCALILTPFVRGCETSLGFPLPFMTYNPGGPKFDIPCGWLLFCLNLAVITALVKYAALKVTEKTRVLAIYDAMLFNIFANWSLFIIYIATAAEETESLFLGIYVKLLFAYVSFVPERAFDMFYKDWMSLDVFDDIVYRLWFIASTLMCVIIFYYIRIFNIRKRKEKKR